jgi:LacI family repressor for deo operon, udp, cdd, tsx, nupC, and nupG
MPKPRLTEVAEFAGVSEATVSRVLNERPGVADVTKQQVLTALDVLGYERPSKLRSRSAGLVGLIVPELDNPIFPVMAQVLQIALAQNGYTAVLCTQTPDSIGEDDYVGMLSELGVSGIVFVSGLHADATADPERYRSLVRMRLPIVLVNGFSEGVPAPFLSTDDRAAMDVAVQHLESLGHRRIGLAIGPDRFVPVRRKREGFLAAMDKHLGVGAAEAARLIEVTIFSQQGGYAAAEALLGRGATAIVCGSDLMALGAIRAVRALGGTVPATCSVIGFDDSTLMSFTEPPLTTLRQPVQELALAAVRALLEEINGDEIPKSEFLFAPELIVRGSTGSAPTLTR